MINLRYANKKDAAILLEWVNNFDSISTKLDNESAITLYEHSNWFSERLKDKNTHIWIIEKEKKYPIGQIRFQQKISNYFDVDIYVVEEERKKGLASKTLRKAVRISKSIPLRALVKKNNLRSYNFFSKNGFLLKSEDQSKWILIKE